MGVLAGRAPVGLLILTGIIGNGFGENIGGGIGERCDCDCSPPVYCRSRLERRLDVDAPVDMGAIGCGEDPEPEPGPSCSSSSSMEGNVWLNSVRLNIEARGEEDAEELGEGGPKDVAGMRAWGWVCGEGLSADAVEVGVDCGCGCGG